MKHKTAKERTTDLKKEWDSLYQYTKNDRHPVISFQCEKIINYFQIRLGQKIDCLLDVGPGHAGSEAWAFKDMIPNCKTLGFEPSEKRYELLVKQNYPGLIYNKALTSKEGLIDCAAGHEEGKSDYKTCISENSIDLGFYKKTKVLSDTVDNVIKDTELENIFLWADIEGAELDMLHGAKKSLENKRIIGMNLELNFRSDYISSNDCNYLDVIEFLSEYDYGLPLDTLQDFKSCVYEGIMLTPDGHGAHTDCVFLPKHLGGVIPEVKYVDGKRKIKFNISENTNENIL